ncbi:MAG TPA: type IV pilus modification protein PilV, partial [Burkholderiaceae bacterium]
MTGAASSSINATLLASYGPARYPMKNNAVHSLQKSQNGFSLIEVLVSIIVFSFGLLGMVGLQASALQANRDARMQAVAVDLARELAEKMRGSKNIAKDATAANPYLGDFTGPPLVPGAANYCLAVGATPCVPWTSIAPNFSIGQAEMTEWLAQVSKELPSPSRVQVCMD